jgi:hypothetical protein
LGGGWGGVEGSVAGLAALGRQVHTHGAALAVVQLADLLQRVVLRHLLNEGRKGGR